MEHMNMGRWLKGVAIATGIIGALGFFVVLPVYSQIICRRVPEFAPAALPWLIFFWVMAVPCYLALYQFWRICCEIGRDNSFCVENVRALRRIAALALVDCGICLAGNVLFTVLGYSTAFVFLLFLLIVFIGAVIAVMCEALARLVDNASRMKAENDLTI
ncbi:MAG: DUF2975 domain-containing protein [Ruminococcaceae bacterium]|nr:DUF2975 domain-containing protein [Oscillospiraceae bacterium]